MNDTGLKNGASWATHAPCAAGPLLKIVPALIAVALLAIAVLAPLRASIETVPGQSPVTAIRLFQRAATREYGRKLTIGRHPAVAAVARQAGPLPVFALLSTGPSDEFGSRQ
jgi:hypothetical protein